MKEHQESQFYSGLIWISVDLNEGTQILPRSEPRLGNSTFVAPSFSNLLTATEARAPPPPPPATPSRDGSTQLKSVSMDRDTEVCRSKKHPAVSLTQWRIRSGQRCSLNPSATRTDERIATAAPTAGHSIHALYPRVKPLPHTRNAITLPCCTATEHHRSCSWCCPLNGPRRGSRNCCSYQQLSRW